MTVEHRKTLNINKTMLYLTDKEAAMRLVNTGFIPVSAENVQVGDVVQTRQDFGGFAFGKTTNLRIDEVGPAEEFEIRFRFSNGDYCTVDDTEEIWIKQ